MVIGTLRDQLMYPNNDANLSDAELAEALIKVRLPKLIERTGGLDSTCDWSKTLSLGEQQRLAIARVFLSGQTFVVLDEATSALDEENEAEVYGKLASAGITLVSISHRTSVARFHNQVLILDGEGGWTLHTAEDYLSEIEQNA